MRASRNITVSLPQAILEKLDELRDAQGWSRAALVRQALHAYLARRLTVVRLSTDEMHALRRGGEEERSQTL